MCVLFAMADTSQQFYTKYRPTILCLTQNCVAGSLLFSLPLESPMGGLIHILPNFQVTRFYMPTLLYTLIDGC